MSVQNTFLTVAEALKNSNSTANQHIKGQLVEREVYLCLSYLMDELFKASNLISSKDADLPNYEDIENLYSYPEYRGDYADFDGGTEEQRDAEVERFQELYNEQTDERATADEAERARTQTAIEIEIEALKELESTPQDVYEYWAVGGMLFEDLKNLGEPVIEYANLKIWGRTCTGQAILLDHTISVIAANMGILEGHEHSWADRK